MLSAAIITHLRSCDEQKRLFSHATSQNTCAAPGFSRESRSTKAGHTECTRGCAAVDESSAGRSASRCCLENSADELAASRGHRAVAVGERRSASFTASRRASASAVCAQMRVSARCNPCGRTRAIAPQQGDTAIQQTRPRLTALYRAWQQLRRPAALGSPPRPPRGGSLVSEAGVSVERVGRAARLRSRTFLARQRRHLLRELHKHGGVHAARAGLLAQRAGNCAVSEQLAEVDLARLGALHNRRL
jgi:hypothetical protein